MSNIRSDKVVLLVEDNPDDEELTLRAFNKAKICNKIEVVRDGVEALDYLFAKGKFAAQNASDKPAVVLLDLKLPKIDGLEVLAQMRSTERTRRIPVVVLTSSDEETDIIKSYDNGANSYICKPVDFQKFISAVGQLGVYWLLLNENPRA